MPISVIENTFEKKIVFLLKLVFLQSFEYISVE